MTLKEIGEGINRSLEEKVGLTIDGERMIRKIDGELYFSLHILTKYGNIVRAVLRDRFWAWIKREDNDH